MALNPRKAFVWDSANLVRAPQGKDMYGTVLNCLGHHKGGVCLGQC